ncbi:flavodoxin-dependent (E)-4-hydroxy-3-methylbut-2-enyl-diphosphate synthase, partial [Myxococcota bacterium]|nr:flavodoxin-dependent (E)-4-hydroxy-3-methylbut-2-enyl-diphosphate synthase [Myxococcota bacterium]
GMVESALEFLDVCEQEDYREVVFSMKASYTHVALQAYRLLAARLAERSPSEPSYPFHLGVTEAGDAEDGRIKSAIGIGGLLEDGLGDTIRVSLTEDPVREIPVARRIADRAMARWQRGAAQKEAVMDHALPYRPFEYHRRETARRLCGGLVVGGEKEVAVELDLGASLFESSDLVEACSEVARSLAEVRDVAAESLLIDVEKRSDLERVSEVRRVLDQLGLSVPLAIRMAPELFGADCALPAEATRLVVPFTSQGSSSILRSALGAVCDAGRPVEWALKAEIPQAESLVQALLADWPQASSPAWMFSIQSTQPIQAVRALAAWLSEGPEAAAPIVLRHSLIEEGAPSDAESALIAAAVDLGAPLCDGLGDMISLGLGPIGAGAGLDLAYRILQGARLRTTRTEYISCPSCGRTLFDLEETTARIKAATGHLSGVKIAVMGCIVNGPGEMADADFGYVGSGPGKVNLYAGKQVVARGVPESDATERLVSLIQEQGRWSRDDS